MRSIERYIPGGVWYDWFESGGAFYSEGKVFELDAPFHTIPLLLRGGRIIPAQAANTTTTQR